MSTIIQKQLGEGNRRGFYALILPVIFEVFSIMLTLGITFGVLPQFIHERLGYDTVIVGLVIGLQNITALLTRSIAGRNTDTKGPKSSVVRGVVGVAISGALYALAGLSAGLPSLSLGCLILARVIHGIGESYLITGALTWGVGLAGVQSSGKVMAWVGISIYAGIGLGAPLGNWMRAHSGIASAFALIALLPIAGCLPMLKLPTVGVNARKNPISFFQVVRVILKQGASLALSTIGFSCISSFISLFFSSRGWGEASLAFTIFATAYILIRLFFASFPDKYGGFKIGACSLLIEIAGQLLLWLAVSRTMALMGCALTGIGFSLIFPSMGVEAVKKVGPEMRGSAMGAFTAFADLAFGITGPVAGLIAGYFGYQNIYLFGTICCISSLLLIVLRFVKPVGVYQRA